MAIKMGLGFRVPESKSIFFGGPNMAIKMGFRV
jgi:hypothetical protein